MFFTIEGGARHPAFRQSWAPSLTGKWIDVQAALLSTWLSELSHPLPHQEDGRSAYLLLADCSICSDAGGADGGCGLLSEAPALQALWSQDSQRSAALRPTRSGAALL